MKRGQEREGERDKQIESERERETERDENHIFQYYMQFQFPNCISDIARGHSHVSIS